METRERSENINLNDFSVICRTCLSKEGLKPLENIKLLDLFKKLTDIQIEIEDQLPTNVCYKCVKKLEDISSFIINWKNTDTYLKQVLESSRDKPDIAESDSEVPELLDYSDQFEEEIIEIKIENKVETKSRRPKAKKKTVRSRKRQPSKCEICSEEFSTKSRLVQHQKENVKCRVNYKCNKCNKTFNTSARLVYHMRCHSEDIPYQCEVCLKKFRHAANLRRHINIVHRGLKPFKCEVCGKAFTRLMTKTEHLSKHTGDKPYSCKFCCEKFQGYSHYFAHLYLHRIQNGEIKNTDLRVTQCESTKQMRVECIVCNKTLLPRTIYQHCHTVKKGSECEHLNRDFLCTVCGRSFLRKIQLDSHYLIHTGEKPYTCKNCNKTFRHSSTYRTHLKLHTGEKPYTCEVCQRMFSQAEHLRQHTRTHTGEKPFKCNFCGKYFALKSNLRVHTRIHTGETPYKCSVCSKGFYDSTSMKRHMKGHHTGYKDEFIDEVEEV